MRNVFSLEFVHCIFYFALLASCEYEEPVKPDRGSVKDCVFDSVVLRTEVTTRQSKESSN